MLSCPSNSHPNEGHLNSLKSCIDWRHFGLALSRLERGGGGGENLSVLILSADVSITVTAMTKISRLSLEIHCHYGQKIWSKNIGGKKR